jgi:1,4-dihydroxy-2-naphthoyl-CoA synthase
MAATIEHHNPQYIYCLETRERSRSMKLEDILYEKELPLAVATFNRLDRLNAFRTRTFDDFEAILDDAATDDELREGVASFVEGREPRYRGG